MLVPIKTNKQLFILITNALVSKNISLTGIFIKKKEEEVSLQIE